jgi:hypothetical protein
LLSPPIDLVGKVMGAFPPTATAMETKSVSFCGDLVPAISKEFNVIVYREPLSVVAPSVRTSDPGASVIGPSSLYIGAIMVGLLCRALISVAKPSAASAMMAVTDAILSAKSASNCYQC